MQLLARLLPILPVQLPLASIQLEQKKSIVFLSSFYLYHLSLVNCLPPYANASASEAPPTISFRGWVWYLDILVRREPKPPLPRLPSTAASVSPSGSPDYTMVPTSALRETIVLIIFGIVLVPIAAKRAQDAPGYWKAFAANAQQSLLYHDRQSPTSALMLTTACDDTVYPSFPIEPDTVVGLIKKPQRRNSHSLTWPQRNETTNVDLVAKESRAESKGPLTIRFRMSQSEAAAPATVTEVGANMDAAKVPTSAISTEVDLAASPTATTTSAANRERWTLIWMGTAIAAVALFMSSC